MDIFVYGTLMNDEIVQALCGRKFDKQRAFLRGYFVSKLSDRYSPGMVELPDSTASGYILLDVDDASSEIIQAWEADDYEKISVQPEQIEKVCQAYLWKSDILGKEWSNDTFRTEHMAWYLGEDIPNFLKAYLKTKQMVFGQEPS